MLLQENFIRHFQYFTILQRFQGTNPFTFSPAQKLVENSEKKLKWEYIKTLTYTFFVAVLFVQLVLQRADVPLAITLESLLLLVAHSVYCFTKWRIFQGRKGLIELHHVFLRFEEQLLKGNYHTRVLDPKILKNLNLVDLFQKMYPQLQNPMKYDYSSLLCCVASIFQL